MLETILLLAFAVALIIFGAAIIYNGIYKKPKHEYEEFKFGDYKQLTYTERALKTDILVILTINKEKTVTIAKISGKELEGEFFDIEPIEGIEVLEIHFEHE